MTLSSSDLKLLEIFTSKYEEQKKEITNNSNNNKKEILNTIKENKIKSQDVLDIVIHSKNINSDYIIKKNSTLGIDRNSDKKLSRGEYKIDYRLDLHGETLETAYNKVKSLFELALLNEYRCLLIITGKGLRSNNITIKESIVKWFKEPFFSNNIIKYIDANKKDGGSGALYILLKNKKSS